MLFSAAQEALKAGIQTLVSAVPLMLIFFTWRHHQAAIKNCCHLAALQTEVWSGRWKMSLSGARLALGVVGACLQVGGCEKMCCDLFQAPERRKRADPSE